MKKFISYIAESNTNLPSVPTSILYYKHKNEYCICIITNDSKATVSVLYCSCVFINTTVTTSGMNINLADAGLGFHEIGAATITQEWINWFQQQKNKLEATNESDLSFGQVWWERCEDFEQHMAEFEQFKIEFEKNKNKLESQQRVTDRVPPPKAKRPV